MPAAPTTATSSSATWPIGASWRDCAKAKASSALTSSLPFRVEFSPDGRYLGAIYHLADRFSARIWDLERGDVVLKVPAVHGILPAFRPDGQQVAIGCRDGTVRLYELPSGKETKRMGSVLPVQLIAFKGPAGMICFSPSGEELAVCNGVTRNVALYRVATLEREQQLGHPGDWLETLAWHPDGRNIATACGNRIYLWDVRASAKPRLVLDVESTRVTSLGFSRQGDILASNGYDGVLRFWSPWTGKELVGFPGVSDRVPLQFSRDDSSLPCLRGAHAAIVAVAPGREQRRVPIQAWGIGDFSPRWPLLAVADREGVMLWDKRSGRDVGRLPLPGTRWVFFDPVGDELVTSGTSGLLRWPVATSGLNLHVGPPVNVQLPAKARDTMAVSRDGATLVAKVDSQSAIVFRPGAASEPVQFADHPGMTYVALSPDGKWAASGPWNGARVLIWDAATGQKVAELPEMEGIPRATVAFSPDGRWLVTGTHRDYRFWHVATWQPGLRVPWTGGGDLPGRMAFSPDSRLLAVKHATNAVKLRDAQTGAEVLHVDVPGASLVEWLTFAPDGGHLAVHDERGTCYFWDLRLIREQLAKMGLDWEQLAYPPVPTDAAAVLHVRVDLGNLPTGALAAKHFNQGMMHIKMKRWADAATSLTRAVELKPDYVGAWGNLGAVQLQLKDWNKAADAYTKALALQEDNAMYWQSRGIAYLQMQQAERAAADFSKAKEVAGTNAQVWFQLGQSHDTTRQWREGIECYSRVIDLQPEHAAAWYERGASYRLLKEYPLAVADFDKAVALQPDKELYCRLRGDLHVEMGTWDKAEADYAKVVELTPSSAAAHGKLAWLLANCPDVKRRNPPEALRLAKKAVDLAPKVGDWHVTVAAAHYRGGDFQATLAALEKSMPLRKGGNSFDWLFQAMAQWRLGNRAEARKWYDQAASRMDKNPSAQTVELRRLRAEAAELLGIEAPKDKTK